MGVKKILPIAPLMIEHRLIERMIGVIDHEAKSIKKTGDVDSLFIDKAVDFIRTYADQTHHGKEEEILFRELKKKELDPDHLKIMNELIEEHKYGRKTTGALVDANKRYQEGDKSALNDIVGIMEDLAEFYPKHIDKEDNYFFKPVMKYFSKKEQKDLLDEGRTFDRRMIHRKYKDMLWAIKEQKNVGIEDLHDNWLEYL